jgi:hypothetical protein
MPDPDQGRVNTVIVTGRLSKERGTPAPLIFGLFAGRASADVRAMAAATLDRGVRGFRPLYGPVPLAPVALLSDLSASDARSWEARVELGHGPDAARFDRDLGGIGAGPDGIHEMDVVYATDPAHVGGANAVIIEYGTSDLFRSAAQLERGLTADDLSVFGGRIVLPESGGLDVTGRQVGPAGDSPEIAERVRTLDVLRANGQVRIWPLYAQFQTGTNQALVSGFVAARVVSVVPPAADEPLRFTLQATFVARPDAVTDTDLRGPAATMNGNRYVCKVRRAE